MLHLHNKRRLSNVPDFIPKYACPSFDFLMCAVKTIALNATSFLILLLVMSIDVVCIEISYLEKYRFHSFTNVRVIYVVKFIVLLELFIYL